jgi:hypothetical protein
MLKNLNYVPSLTTMVFDLLYTKKFVSLLSSRSFNQYVLPILTQTENVHHHTQQFVTYSPLKLNFPHPFTTYNVCN